MEIPPGYEIFDYADDYATAKQYAEDAKEQGYKGVRFTQKKQSVPEREGEYYVVYVKKEAGVKDLSEKLTRVALAVSERKLSPAFIRRLEQSTGFDRQSILNAARVYEAFVAGGVDMSVVEVAKMINERAFKSREDVFKIIKLVKELRDIWTSGNW